MPRLIFSGLQNEKLSRSVLWALPSGEKDVPGT